MKAQVQAAVPFLSQTYIYFIIFTINKVAGVVFTLIPVLFAISIAFGMVKQEKEIAAFKPAVKTIIGKSACRCEECAEFTAIEEGDHICGADPHKMPVSDYTPTEDYFWCKGAHFSSMEG